jgi:hypothetical protein
MASCSTAMSVRIMTLAWAPTFLLAKSLSSSRWPIAPMTKAIAGPDWQALRQDRALQAQPSGVASRARQRRSHHPRREPRQGHELHRSPGSKKCTRGKKCTGSKICRRGGKKCHRGVAKNAPKPSLNRKEPSPSKLRAIPDDWQPAEFAIGTESRKVVDGWPPGELPAQSSNSARTTARKTTPSAIRKKLGQHGF